MPDPKSLPTEAKEGKIQKNSGRGLKYKVFFKGRVNYKPGMHE